MSTNCRTVGLTALYFVIVGTGLLRHELWLDEAHHWLLARDSASLSALWEHTRMEGHPLLWSLLLYGVTRFTSDPAGMQMLQLIIATITVWVFLRQSPFSWRFKALFIFGYFMVFEYGVISRNYMLGVLFLFLACGTFGARREKFPLFCLYLALAANVHVLFGVIALALLLPVFSHQMAEKQLLSRATLYGYALLAAGFGFVIWQILQTEPAWLLEPIQQLPLLQRLQTGAGSLFKGLLNVPDFRTLHFWNSNYIVAAFRPLASVLALLLFALPVLLFTRSRQTLLFVCAAIIGLQFFFFVTQRAAVRFHGAVFFIVIIALWTERFFCGPSAEFSNVVATQSCRLQMAGDL